MNAHTISPTTRRTRFTWSCSLAPIALFVVFVTMAVHIRLSFGYWPDQFLDRLTNPLLRVHGWALLGAIVFGLLIAPLHLVVTAIHFRELGLRLRQLAIHATIYLAGALVFLLVIANVPARFVTWFTD